MLVFGTRPEAIKMAPLVKELKKHTDVFHTVVCVTAQHRELLDQVLHVFGIVPDYDLNIMRQDQDLYDITSQVLLKMRAVLNEVRPDLLLVHGDTTTSTATALAAFYRQIPVGHVEAGLRTRNIYSPWPEEMNRQLTGRIATYHFAPTDLSRRHLEEEHVHGRIFVTGNTVIDALHIVMKRLADDKTLVRELCDAIAQAGYLAAKYPNVDFIYPMHLNPNVRQFIRKVMGNEVMNNLFFLEPMQYLQFVFLMEKATLILTDSGGIQEEAPGLGKPVLVMRDTTERPEAVQNGTIRLVGTNYDAIVSETSRLLDDAEAYRRMAQAVNPYGDGHASERIVEVLIKEDCDE